MPTYQYNCANCVKEYEIIVGIKEYIAQKPYACPTCSKVGERILSCNFEFYGEKVESAEYNPAFGKVVKNKRERLELAKRLNVIEIGNENPDKIHDNFDKQREEKRRKAYEDI